MKTRLSHLLLLLTVLARIHPAAAQGTAFNYSGQLDSGGSPANGSYDLAFTLYNASTNGTASGALTNLATPVSNGLFNVTLDFGGVFNGTTYWLQIAVRTNGGGAFTNLTPLQQILPAPYAIYAPNAGSAASASSVAATNIAGTLPLAQLPGAVVTNNSTSLTLSGTFTGNGAGLTGVPGTFAWQNVTGTSQQAQPNTGYLANNASQVTITLPASPNLGDIVRVSGVGAGGWQIAQNAGQSIQAGALGGSYNYSSLVTNWMQTSAPVTNWQAIASSSDGNMLAAVVSGGGICTSTNSGASWTQSSATNAGWQAIASSADGTRLVAQSANNGNSALNGIYISTNSGVSWIQNAQNIGSGASVASSADGTILVDAQFAFGIYVSTNSGATWISGTATPPLNNLGNGGWDSIACSTDGTKMVAAQNNNSPYGGIGSICLSTNWGVNWTLSSAPTNVNWLSVASSADGTKLAAVVRNGGFYISSNSGATWLQASMPTNNPGGWGQFVASSAAGDELVEAVYGGGIWIAQATIQPTTTPGISGYLTGGQNTAIELQYTGNGQWLPVSYAGTISAY